MMAEEQSPDAPVDPASVEELLKQAGVAAPEAGPAAASDPVASIDPAAIDAAAVDPAAINPAAVNPAAADPAAANPGAANPVAANPASIEPASIADPTRTTDPLASAGQAANFGSQIDPASAGVDVLLNSGSADPFSGDPSGDPLMDAAAIDALLQQASFEDPSTIAGAPLGAGAAEFKLPNFQQVMKDAQVSSIELLRDVELNVKIELGRSRMLVEDVLKLAEGSVVELDKLAGDPVDVFVNDRLVARGEVLVLNDNFCVRVNEIVAGAKEEGL